MAEDNKLPKEIKTTFVGDTTLPIHYINIVNVRGGAEEFYFTLGQAMPLEITDIKDLENLDHIIAQPLFRFALPRSVMKQLIDLMQRAYDQQTSQLAMTQPKEEDSNEH